jgi:hypothetical protein
MPSPTPKDWPKMMPIASSSWRHRPVHPRGRRVPVWSLHEHLTCCRETAYGKEEAEGGLQVCPKQLFFKGLQGVKTSFMAKKAADFTGRKEVCKNGLASACSEGTYKG